MENEYLKIVLRNIKNRKKRSVLNIISILIGIAAIVSLISISQGMENAVSEQFEMMGTDIILITPGSGGSFSTFAGTGGSSSKLTDHDLDIIEKVKGVEIAGGMVMKVSRVTFRDESEYTWVMGVPTDETQDVFLNMENINIVEGKKEFKESDKNVAIIGHSLANGDFFDKKVKLGNKLSIDGREVEIISILGKIGSPEDDKSIMIPLQTIREFIEDTDSYFMLMAEVKEGFDPTNVAEDIEDDLRDDRNLEEGEEDFSVETSEQLMETISSVLGMIQIVIIGIASISLLVGGIGIMNTMYTSVLERTRDIGVMKAIGAKNIHILGMFLLEAGIFGLIGGVLGCSIGMGLAKAVEMAAGQFYGSAFIKVTVSPLLIVGSLVFSFLIGAIAGILPSRKASKMKPVDALRYE